VNEVAFSLLLSAHLICVNIASGGPIVAAWLDWRGTRGDLVAVKAAVYLARVSLVGFVLGATLGLAIGWLKWNAAYRSLWLGPLSYKLHGAAIEALFSLVLLSGWWVWLPGRAGTGSRAMATRGLIALLASTNLLYHFPLLFSVAARLDGAGRFTGPVINGAAFRRLMVEAETPALAIHVVLASLAVAGMVLVGQGVGRLRAGDPVAATKLAISGGRWALASSLAQLPVGLWTLTALPDDVQSQLMGDDIRGTLLFATSLAAALWLVNDLARVALGEIKRSLLIRAITAMLLTVILMTAMQQQIRLRHQLPSTPSMEQPR
jgi:hypothetical protein